VLHPLRRSGAKGSGQFERVSWDEALTDIAARLQGIIDRDGASAILPYSYLGTQGLIQSNGLSARFFARLGATRLERAICGGASGAGLMATNGTSAGMLPEQIQHSRFILLWGTNTVVTNLHLWHFIRIAKRNGARIVVIDPVRTRTTHEADWYLQIRPGTDAALALGMMDVIIAENLHDPAYVAAHTIGFEALRQRAAEYDPERVAHITGLAVQDIVALARAYATTRPACIRTLVGMEHRQHGAMTFRTIGCLSALIGAWKEMGGGHLHMTAALHMTALNVPAVRRPDLEDTSIRSINMVRIGQALNDVSLAPPIRALIVFNSNPAAIAPNQALIMKGLEREDLFTVVLEQFMTDTAVRADYILPATTQLEHLDLMWSWGHTYLMLNRPAIAPVAEALPNTEIFRRLAKSLGFTEPYLFDSDEELVRAALSSDHPWLAGITFERLWEQGWVSLNLPADWLRFENGGFPTASGKCELFSQDLSSRGFDPLPAYSPARRQNGMDPGYPLLLTSAKSELHFLNSSYANLPRQLHAAREPLLDMHPADAQRRGIAGGMMAHVFNERGRVTARVRVGDRVGEGSVALPSGWWASLSAGGAAVNALTADGLSDWGGGGDFHDTFVDVALMQ
jgi:anaerobic selenocysteine-containing dehydrogenase